MASQPPIADLTSSPTAGQIISHQGKEYQTIQEGAAYILVPKHGEATKPAHADANAEKQTVFYNPIQQFNRDLSVLAIRAYGEGIIARKAATAERVRSIKLDKKRKKRKRAGNDAAGSEESTKSAKLTTTGSEESSQSAKLASGLERSNEKVEPEDGQSSLATQSREENKLADDVASLEQAGGHGHEGESKDQASHVESEGGEKQPLHDTPEQTAVAAKDPSTSTNGEHTEQTTAEPVHGAPDNELPQPSFTVLDALSATGLRALRYAHEIPFVTNVMANDLLSTATQSIKLNVTHNRLDDRIKTNTGNAMTHMYGLCSDASRDRPAWSKKYDVIDLDPYGTAAPFFDSAVQAVRDDGGMLCVTCTDAGVWASNAYPEKAYSLYGGTTIKGMHSHEGGLRLILQAIANSAARYGLAIEPLLSLSIDFYARLFVRVYRSPADVKFLAGKSMVVYNCDHGCGAWSTQSIGRNRLAPNKSGKDHFWKYTYSQGPPVGETCPHCGYKTHLAGPMYAGPLHSADFISKILESLPQASSEIYHTKDRIEGMLTLALEELLPDPPNPNSPTDSSRTGKYDPATLDSAPFFFKPDLLAKVLHCNTPHEAAIKGALRHLGYRATRSHTKPGSIKTDAPWSIIWDVMREWVRQKSPVAHGRLKPGTAGYRILRLDQEGEEEKKTEPKEEQATDEDVPMSEDAVENGASDEQNGHAIELAGKDATPLKIVFDEKLGREKEKRRLLRYQVNPRENWGPMPRAKGPSGGGRISKDA